MVQKPRAVKYKVVAGYVLLFAMAVLSVWVVYTEILKIAASSQGSEDNKKIIQISNAIANLYASEAVGRSAILTGSEKEFRRYNLLIDSVQVEIEDIKKQVEENQIPKFDSIQFLLNRKKNSITEIIAYRKKYGQGNTFTQAIEGVYTTKDSIWNKVKPVKITKRHEWQTTVNSLLTPRLKDSLSKLQVSNDSLAMAFDKVISNLLIKDNKLKYILYRKEQKLLDENRIISDQLRVVLASVENDIFKKSYATINESQATVDKTIRTIAWIGAITLLLLIFFAWIIIRDLSTNQNYRKQLELLNQQNEELLRTKTMLMATVTHDLQTPLGSIIGFHDLIRDSGISPKQKQYLGNIRESADYILKLVNDLLDFSRLENNRISIEKTGFNIKNVIENTCRTLEPMALNKSIELNWDIDEELNANFISDPYRIRQVLTNLISNAIKFTPEGSVEVTGKIEGSNIHISVLDTGIGIAKNKHADVFKEFTQAHSGIEKKFGGTGLGLTISSRIIELLSGEIVLESEEGQGSIFTIILPCIAATNNFKEKTPAKVHNNYAFLKDKKILIVDDDTMQLTLMKELLLNYPLAITTEINTLAVLPLLENGQFDLLMTDIQMPALDGFELVKLIRNHANSHISNLPVIALSGKRDLTAKDFTDGGFTAHHPKPIQLELLLELISQLFGGNDHPAIENTIPKTKTGPVSLYNLRSLSQFTNNDPESLKTILNTFIESANDNCEALKAAVSQKDEQKITEIAHKMIPMLKQMEVHSIARLLIPLEDSILNMQWNEIENSVADILKRIENLCSQLTNEMA
jgi:signal transduction histidine kinase/DNA-binding response OmpR family regulator